MGGGFYGFFERLVRVICLVMEGLCALALLCCSKGRTASIDLHYRANEQMVAVVSTTDRSPAVRRVGQRVDWSPLARWLQTRADRV